MIVEQDPTASGRLVCTNHLLHRWPDPTQLPDDYGPIGTAALTYHRWRTLTAANAGGAVVDRDDIRDQFAGGAVPGADRRRPARSGTPSTTSTTPPPRSPSSSTTPTITATTRSLCASN